MHSTSISEKVLALCDSACSRSWISVRLAKRLKVQGVARKLTVHGNNSFQVVNTAIVELKLTPVHSGGSCSPFTIKPYVQENLNVGTDTIDMNYLETKNPHLEPISLQKYSYADVDLIPGQDVFHFVRPLEHFDSDRKNTPVVVRLPLGRVLSRPLPSTSVFYSTYVDQLRSWYDKESYGAFKQVDSRSAVDARAEKILDDTTYHDGSRYHVGMLWAGDENSLIPIFRNYYLIPTFRL